MKKFLISSIIVLAVLMSASTIFGQSSDQSGPQRERFENVRQDWQNMSEEEREKLRDQMRNRVGSGGAGLEGQLQAIKTIEGHLVQLKAALESMKQDRGQYQNIPEEERAKFRDKIAKAAQTRQQAVTAIEQELAKFRYRRPRQQQSQPEQQSQEPQMRIKELQEIHLLAIKEKAKETTKRLESFIAKYIQGGSRTQGIDRPLRRGQVDRAPMPRQQQPRLQEGR